ncbi:carboxysome peptide B [Acidihalobacter yilgarnensis]|uniref:Carboxysome peptide B n=1 Tax=Acidihalobacter yilgarnensis TaxID=2819280 RepID=A0A1D8IK79_9GAMM|nr:carboxysome peptide B [Acidihalobacter yilgarnensis]AOU96862.1 carboxysome peptide B [Acidihalobacter yilgarnensis]
MEIMRVKDDLVCTRRAAGLGGEDLRILESLSGALSVAVDPVGAPAGSWVFTTSGSAARYALPDPRTLTDLTICGIIDHWEVAQACGMK